MLPHQHLEKKLIKKLFLIDQILPCRSAYDFFNLPILVVILTLKWTSPRKD